MQCMLPHEGVKDGLTYVVVHTLWYIRCGTYVVVHTLWYIRCGTYVVVHTLWYIRCGTYVVVHTWGTSIFEGRHIDLRRADTSIFEIRHVDLRKLTHLSSKIEGGNITPKICTTLSATAACA